MPWKSRPPALLTTSMVTGPLACSAPKLDCSTLNSPTMSGFGFTDVAQLQPGIRGMRAVDDDVERVDAGAVAGEVADGALLAAVAVAVDADDLAAEAGALLVPPASVGVMPGSSFSSSAVMRPTIGTFWICSEVRRALFSPESIGAISGRDTTEITVSRQPPTFRADAGDRAALARGDMAMSVASQAVEALRLDLAPSRCRRAPRRRRTRRGVGDRALRGLRCLVGQRHVGAGQHAALGVRNRGRNCAGERLRTGRRWQVRPSARAKAVANDRTRVPTVDSTCSLTLPQGSTTASERALPSPSSRCFVSGGIIP